jgi:hypothetical protein
MRCTTSSQKPFAKVTTRFLAVVVACASLTFCQANVEAAEPLSTSGLLSSVNGDQLRTQELLFHITDFGINQPWEQSAKIGDPFGENLNRVYPELNNKPGAQILVQMPEDSELDRLDPKHWADLVASTLVEKVHAAREQGTTEFEIQIVENMRWGAYALPSQQGRVNTFANAVYTAVGSLVTQEKASARGIAVDVTAGSNGTEAFTQSRSSWEPYRDDIRSVSLVDGRAFYEPTKEAIQSLGANKVFISVSYGDMPAHDFSIANLSTVQRLVSDNPGLKVVLLEPLDAQKHLFGNAAAPVTPMSSHVLSMVSPDAKFMVNSVSADGVRAIGEFTSRDLRTPSQVWSAVPPFSSQSSFGSELARFNRDTAIDGAADNLDLLPGRFGSFGENLKFGYQALKLFGDTSDSLKTISAHPNDPGPDWERVSVGLNLYSFFGPGKLFPGAAGGLVTVGDFVKTTAEETRSRVMENRAEGLVYSGGMPLNIQEMRERMSAYEGDFSLRGSHVDADGGWALDHFSQHPFERDSQSYSWADTRISNLRLNNGSFMSGTFSRDEQNDERGGSLWNLYEPTSVTITRRSQDHYRVTFDGANWNKDFQQTDNQAQQTKVPAASVPNIAPPKSLPLPYVNDTKYPPPNLYPIYGEPPKFTPAGSVGGFGRELGGGAGFTAPVSLPFQQSQTPMPPMVKGVLMPVNVTNRPIDVEKFLHD